MCKILPRGVGIMSPPGMHFSEFCVMYFFDMCWDLECRIFRIQNIGSRTHLHSYYEHWIVDASTIRIQNIGSWMHPQFIFIILDCGCIHHSEFRMFDQFKLLACTCYIGCTHFQDPDLEFWTCNSSNSSF